jgi:hypothetical protein
MKRVSILLATGLFLVGGLAGRAAADEGVSGTIHLAPAPSASVGPCCGPSGCGGDCGQHCAASCDAHCGKFLDWLLYKPPATHCACHHAVAPCFQEPYVYFLDMCAARGPGGCGGHGCRGDCGHAVEAPCGGGCCPAREHPLLDTLRDMLPPY